MYKSIFVRRLIVEIEPRHTMSTTAFSLQIVTAAGDDRPLRTRSPHFCFFKAGKLRGSLSFVGPFQISA